MGGPTSEQRGKTLERFERHRAAWESNAALRALYAGWYGRVAQALPDVALGPRLELGSGPGIARSFIPDMELTDLVKAPWHDREMSAQELPLPDQSVGALVLFDVLHHLPSPRLFFEEAARVLRPGGRVVLCEPYMSLLSYPVYKFLHDEPVDLSVDPLTLGEPIDTGTARDPFDANQAIPTVLFLRRRASFERSFPSLSVRSVERLAGPSYVASGGFSRKPLLPAALWNALYHLESRLPEALFRFIGFRLLVVIERT